jgi:hypothetical protein
LFFHKIRRPSEIAGIYVCDLAYLAQSR